MKISHLFAALLLGALPVSAAKAAGVSITVAPPPLLVYEQPACPVEGYLWTPGYWAYDDYTNDYYWVDGVWVAPPRIGYLWTPGYWGFGSGFYAFHPGYWGPTVGFYGGINYGYGYGGYGYYGGRWDKRVFRYNTAVTRVNVNNIRNTYVDNHFQARNDSRASFNGRGGIEAKADARERAAANASHARPTAAQASALQQARIAHNPDAQRRTADRTPSRSRHAAPDGPTTDARHDDRASRNANVLTNGTRGNRRTPRDPVSRGNGAGRNRDAFVHNSGRNGGGRSRGPQPGRQQRAAQPRGGGGGKRDGEHRR